MITNGLILLIVNVMGPIVNAVLPPLKLGTLPTLAATAGLKIGHFVKIMGPVVPVTLLVTMFTVLALLMLARAAYFIGTWLFGHVSTVVRDADL